VSDNGDGSNREHETVAGQNEVAHLTELLKSPFRVLSESLLMSKRILVADDSDTVRRVVRSYLIQQDFDVCGEAVDGEDAIEKARKLKPDLILLDVAMPRTNGIETASVLKDMLPNMRIVLFTMYREAVARAFPREALPVDAVIGKGDVSGLADCVQSLLRL
jgi:DNA-binding NarL/FixJ family response regulator